MKVLLIVLVVVLSGLHCACIGPQIGSMTSTGRKVEFASSLVGLTKVTEVGEFVVDFDEPVSVLSGYGCTPWPSSADDWQAADFFGSASSCAVQSSIFGCLSVCVFADPARCGQLDAGHPDYAACRDYDCQPSVYCRAEDSWVNLNDAASHNRSYSLAEGEQLALRLDVAGGCVGGMLEAVVGGGQVMLFASPYVSQPGFDDKYDRLLTVVDTTRASQLLTFCPTRGWQSGHVFFTVLAVGDAQLAFRSDASVPVPAGASSPLLAPSPVRLSADAAWTCNAGDCDAFAAAQQFYVDDASWPAQQGCRELLLVVETAFSSFTKIVQLAHTSASLGVTSRLTRSAPLTALLMCAGDRLDVSVAEAPVPDWGFVGYSDTNTGQYTLTLLASAKFRRTAVTELDMYSASMAELSGAPSLHCPSDDWLDGCAGCQRLVAVFPMAQPVPWPPPPPLYDLVGDWDMQAAARLSPLFDAGLNVQPARLLWFLWLGESPAQPFVGLDRFALAANGSDTAALAACRWAFFPALLGAVSGGPLPPAPGLAAASSSTACAAAAFQTSWTHVELLLAELLLAEAPRTVAQLQYAAYVSLYPDAYANCLLQLQRELLTAERQTSVATTSDACLVPDPRDWAGVPCCDPVALRFDCCVPVPALLATRSLLSNRSQLAAACPAASPDCVASVVADLQRQVLLQLDSVNGCEGTGRDVLAENVRLFAALQTCSAAAFGTDQQNPWQCFDDADCPAGFACAADYSCHVPRAWMEQTYVDCLVGPDSSLSSFVLRQLQFTVGTAAPPRSQQFAADVAAHFQLDDCVQDATLGIPYRRHWQYRALCEDSDICNVFPRLRHIGLADFEADYNILCAERSCSLDFSCLAPFTQCRRVWLLAHPAADAQQCAADAGLRCNWPSCNASDAGCDPIAACLDGPPLYCLAQFPEPMGAMAVEASQRCPGAVCVQPNGSLAFTDQSDCPAADGDGVCFYPSRPDCPDNVCLSDAAYCAAAGLCDTPFYMQLLDNVPYCRFNWLRQSAPDRTLGDTAPYCPAGTFTFTQGCVRPFGAGFLPADCTAQGGDVVAAPYTAAQCLDAYASVCSITSSTTVQQNPANCSSCAGISVPSARYAPATFLTGVPVQTVRKAVLPYYRWTSALDVAGLSGTLRDYIFGETVNTLRSQTLCSLSGMQQLLRVLVCLCNDDATANANANRCFIDEHLLPRSVGYPCPETAYVLAAPPARLVFTNASVPAGQRCEPVAVLVYPRDTFKAPRTQSSPALFNRQIPVRDYRVVNRDGYEVGKIVGDGVRLSRWQFEPPPSSLVGYNVSLCLDVLPNVTVRAAYATPDFGRLVDGDTIRALHLAGVHYDRAQSKLCGVVPALTYESSFFPVLRQADTAAPLEPLFADWELGLIYTTSALYFAVLAMCLVRFAQLVVQRSYSLIRVGNIACLAVFDVFRALYFLLLGLGVWAGTESYVTFLIVDIPYFFFFIGMTLLLWWWVALAWTAEKRNLNRNFYLLCGSTSLLILGLGVVIQSLYATASSTVESQCGGREAGHSAGLSEQNVILVVYKSVLAAFALLACLVFFVTERKLQKIAPGSLGVRLSLLSYVSIASFFGQSLYFIFLAAFSGGDNAFTDSAYSVIPLWFIEVLPQILILLLQSTQKETKPASHRERAYSRTGSSAPLNDLSSASTPERQPRVISDN